jgi:hypothetical protein
MEEIGEGKQIFVGKSPLFAMAAFAYRVTAAGLEIDPQRIDISPNQTQNVSEMKLSEFKTHH